MASIFGCFPACRPPLISKLHRTHLVPLASVPTSMGSGSAAHGFLLKPLTLLPIKSCSRSSLLLMFGGLTLPGAMFCFAPTTRQWFISSTPRIPLLMRLLMRLLCHLLASAARFNFSFASQHVPGVHNCIANALSRFHWQEFEESNGPKVPLKLSAFQLRITF